MNAIDRIGTSHDNVVAHIILFMTDFFQNSPLINLKVFHLINGCVHQIELFELVFNLGA